MQTLLTKEEVAERLSVCTKTVMKWIRTGKLKGVKIGGTLWRIPESELERFIGLHQDDRTTNTQLAG